MPGQVEVWDTELPPEQNPVVMFQIDVAEAMKREPKRFTTDLADYEKRKPSKAKADQANKEAEEARAADPVTSLDTPPEHSATQDDLLEKRRLRALITEKGGKPTNFMSLDELRTVLSQLEGKPLAEENRAS